MSIPFSYLRQIRAVLLIELAILVALGLFVYGVWHQICGSGLQECLAKKDSIGFGTLAILALLRPFLLTPSTFFNVVAANQFGFFGGVFFGLLSTMLSTTLVFFLGKLIGKKLVTPWLRSNLPQTHQFIRSQDYKIVFFARLISFLHFDVCSVLFGALDFRLKSVLLASLAGELPIILLTSYIASGGEVSAGLFSKIILTAVVILVIAIIIVESGSRLKGRGMYSRLMAMYHEIVYEVKVNNEIVKRYTINPEKVPVLLMYGFFSSRRTLTALERQLSNKGYDILSFNLGGLFGVFFTRGIMETARYIDEKLQRQFERKNFSKIHIVAHSKGGLVALWWLLKLGGHRYCDKVICMGTPFQGSRLTYLGLITPLGIVWRDLWQMRPGSPFLKGLRLLDVPDTLSIVCLYSNRDRVAPGACGIYRNKIRPDRVSNLALHKNTHFEFLYKKEVAETIIEYLGPANQKPSPVVPYEDPEDMIDESLEALDPFQAKRANS